jgi:hypothetical protein
MLALTSPNYQKEAGHDILAERYTRIDPGGRPGGPLEFARLGIMQALFPRGMPVCHAVKKDSVWRNRHKPVRDR